jgi:hypothetical protein
MTKPIKAIKLHGGTPTTHGGYTFLTTGRLPEHRREVERYLAEARVGLLEDLAGAGGRVTAAQQILIDRVVTKLGVLRCIEEYVRETAVMLGPDLAPPLGRNYLAYSNSIRLDLQALGVDKRAEERVLGPLEIAAEIDREKPNAEERPAGAQTAEELEPGDEP